MAPKITAADAGCWLDGSQGWHNTYRVCDRAMDYGWLADEPTELDVMRELSARYEAGSTDGDIAEVMSESADDATEYLNSIAPDGYSFVWDAGELSLMADDEAQELGHFG